MVTRGLERNGDSAQFITTMEKPSHLSSWQQNRSCLCVWKGSKPYCFQGPFVFHLLKNQRLEIWRSTTVVTVDLQHRESQQPELLCSPHGGLIAASHVPCGRKRTLSGFWPPAPELPFLQGRAHLLLEDHRASFPSLPCSFGRRPALGASDQTRACLTMI